MQIRTFSTWFVSESHPVVIQRFGLIRAMYLRRDFQYTPGGTSEDVPPEVLGWDPKEQYLRAERVAQNLARRQVNVIRAAAGSMSLAALALAVGLLPVERWIVAAAAIGAAGLRMALAPYWDGRRSLRSNGESAS